MTFLALHMFTFRQTSAKWCLASDRMWHTWFMVYGREKWTPVFCGSSLLLQVPCRLLVFVASSCSAREFLPIVPRSVVRQLPEHAPGICGADVTFLQQPRSDAGNLPANTIVPRGECDNKLFPPSLQGRLNKNKQHNRTNKTHRMKHLHRWHDIFVWHFDAFGIIWVISCVSQSSRTMKGK